MKITGKTVFLTGGASGIGSAFAWTLSKNDAQCGTLRRTNLALAHMRKDKGGQGGVIVNIASSTEPLCARHFLKETMQLTDKVVFVTGGASGIGAACVEAVLEKGAKVCIADTDDGKGKTLAKSINSKYGENKVIFLKCDVTDEASFCGAFQAAVSKFHHIDVMVNNAGIFNEGSWDRMLATNLCGTIHGTNLALAHMRKDKGGQGGVIVNIASSTGLQPYFCVPVYSASKHGVLGFTRSMATTPDIDDQGVRFACICPEATNTSLLDIKPQNIREGYYSFIRERLRNESLLRPETVAESVTSVLADDDSNDILLHVTFKDGTMRKRITVVDA